jgi:hypothetical protein
MSAFDWANESEVQEVLEQIRKSDSNTKWYAPPVPIRYSMEWRSVSFFSIHYCVQGDLLGYVVHVVHLIER